MPSVPAGESAGEDCQCDQDGDYNRPHTTISCLHLSPCLLFLAAMSLSLASAEKEDWSPTEKTGGRRKYLISNSMTFNILWQKGGEIPVKKSRQLV